MGSKDLVFGVRCSVFGDIFTRLRVRVVFGVRFEVLGDLVWSTRLRVGLVFRFEALPVGEPPTLRSCQRGRVAVFRVFSLFRG